MTPKQSTARLSLYVGIALVTSASAGISSVDFSDAKQTIGYILGILATGLVTARSYIDQSPTQIVTDAVTHIAADVVRKRTRRPTLDEQL
jgi:hypothetical protein